MCMCENPYPHVAHCVVHDEAESGRGGEGEEDLRLAMLTSRRHVKLELGIVESEQRARSERGCVASATGIFGEQFWSPDLGVLHFGTLSRRCV